MAAIKSLRLNRCVAGCLHKRDGIIGVRSVTIGFGAGFR
jgi:hypothetical protein